MGSWRYGAALAALLVPCFGATSYADIIYFKPVAAAGTSPGPDEIAAVSLPASVPSKPYQWVYKDASGATQNKTLTAVHGRIVEVITPLTSPPRFEFQPCVLRQNAVGDYRVVWMRKTDPTTGARVAATFPVSTGDLARIEHEVDGMQDLRWMFSNRDDLLRQMVTTPPAGGATGPPAPAPVIQIGWDPFHQYFLQAGGVTGSVPATPGPIPAALLSSDLQEGWLVNWLKQGPTTAAARNQALKAHVQSLSRGQSLQFDPLIRETSISTLVHSLLRVATQDKFYKGIYYYDTNALGQPIDKDGNPTRNANEFVPTFHPVCRRAIMVLCDLATINEATHPNAHRMGMEAREAVIQAIEAAHVGEGSGVDAARRAPGPNRLSSDPTSDLFLKLRAALRDAQRYKLSGDVGGARLAATAAQRYADAVIAKPLDPNDKRRVTYTAPGGGSARVSPGQRDRLKASDLKSGKIAAFLASLPAAAPALTSSPRPELISSDVHFPVDPSLIAVVAMEVIVRSPSWQVPRLDSAVAFAPSASGAPTSGSVDRRGERLVSALMGLSRRSADPTGRTRGPREADLARTEDTAKPAIPAFGVHSPLKHSASRSLEHLLTGTPADAKKFQELIADLLIDGASREERELAADVIGRAGYADPAIMEGVINGLFAIATMPEALEANPGATNPAVANRLRTSLRQQIRRDAVATLANLSTLASSSNPGDKRIARHIFDQVEAMIETQEGGTASEGEEAFFGLMDSMSTVPARPLEARAKSFRDSFTRSMEFREDFSERARVGSRQLDSRMRELRRKLDERLARAGRNFPTANGPPETDRR